MAFALNKRKVLETAQKCAQKGAYDKALREYQKLLDADPRDTSTRLKIGDIHLRRGHADQALETYAQVARDFTESGFDAKGVAIYKQILRIDASCLEARIHLGELFQRLGLAPDALREFQRAVELCEQRGLRREAFDLLKQVAAIDPANLSNRLRLADLLAREGLRDEAHEQYLALIEEMKDQGGWDRLQRVCKQMLQAFPDDPRATEELGRARLSLGDHDAAVELVEQALPRFPESIPLREVLVAAHEARGDQVAASRTYSEIAELHKQQGDEDRARDILQRYVPAQPIGPVEETEPAPSILLSEEIEEDPGAPGILPDAPAPGSAPVGGGEAPPPGPAPEAPGVLEDLMAEARVSLEFGDLTGAEERLDLVLRRSPDHPEARELLEEIRSGSTRSPAWGSPVEGPGAKPLPDQARCPGPPPVLEPEDPRLPEPAEEDLEEIEVDLEIELEESGAGLREADASPRSSDPGDATTSGPLSSRGATAFAADSTRIVEDLGEAERFYEQGMLQEAECAFREILRRVPHHPKAMLRLGEISETRGHASADEAVASSGPAGEEAVPCEEPVPRAEVPGTPHEGFDLAAALEESPLEPGLRDESGGFQAVFSAFKQQIQEQIGEDESEAHYDLAIAYREMGLLADAVSQLEIVRATGSMPIEAFSLLATCKLELGLPQEAAAVLEEAMSAGSEDPVSLVSLRYDLGEAYLAAGERGKALDAFRKVAAVDPGHRDVRERIRQLA